MDADAQPDEDRPQAESAAAAAGGAAAKSNRKSNNQDVGGAGSPGRGDAESQDRQHKKKHRTGTLAQTMNSPHRGAFAAMASSDDDADDPDDDGDDGSQASGNFDVYDDVYDDAEHDNEPGEGTEEPQPLDRQAIGEQLSLLERCRRDSDMTPQPEPLTRR